MLKAHANIHPANLDDGRITISSNPMQCNRKMEVKMATTAAKEAKEQERTATAKGPDSPN